MTAPPKTKIQYRKLVELLPWATNAKLHSQSQVAQLAASIKQFGFTSPVLVADGTILAGHGRVLAAERLGMSEVPTIDLSYLSEAQRRAYVIVDNRLAETGGGWDQAMLRAELDMLGEVADFDLVDIGLDSFDLPGEPELESFATDSDQSHSGAGGNYLAFGDRRMPLDDDELAGLLALADAHMEQTGSPFGFAASIIRRCST